MIWTLLAGIVLQTQKSTVLLGGDIMLNQIPVSHQPFRDLYKIPQPGEVVIANLEIPLTRSTTPTPYKTAAELKARTQYILKPDPKHIDGLSAVGFHMVSLGNNHVMDYGSAGLAEMTSLLDARGILHTGAGPNLAEAKRAISAKGVTLLSAMAFMGTAAMKKLGPATASRPGLHALIFNGTVDAADKKYLKDWIAASPTDGIKIVALHWGLEKHTIPTSYQVALARACIDAGADVVWGHHPHVLQGAELYKGKPILYSMGNLISRKEGPTGLARLYFENEHLKGFRFVPLDIKNMRVAPVPSKLVEARRKAFQGLSNAVQRKFPHKMSKALY